MRMQLLQDQEGASESPSGVHGTHEKDADASRKSESGTKDKQAMRMSATQANKSASVLEIVRLPT